MTILRNEDDGNREEFVYDVTEDGKLQENEDHEDTDFEEDLTFDE